MDVWVGLGWKSENGACADEHPTIDMIRAAGTGDSNAASGLGDVESEERDNGALGRIHITDWPVGRKGKGGRACLCASWNGTGG